jgi:hypothetical protein
MQPPRWDDPIGSACREAEPTILRGLLVRPTLYGFVDGEPVVRVQPGLAELGAGGERASQHLALVPAILGLEQALVFSHARTTDPDVGDDHLRDALASYGITVEVARRERGEVTTEAHLVDRQVVDGEARWDRPTVLAEGLWSGVLHFALAPPAAVAASDVDAARLVYELSRAGTVVEVAPGWRERFGMDRLDRRHVRTVDRRRTRDLARPRPAAAAVARHTGEVGA